MTKGYRTSEFWVTAIAALGAILNQSGLLGSYVLPLEALATIGGVLATYIISRGVSKINQ